MLTVLQRRILGVVQTLPDAEGFAPTGGGVLIVRNLIERDTRDLDFFAPRPELVDRMVPVLEEVLRYDPEISRRSRLRGRNR